MVVKVKWYFKFDLVVWLILLSVLGLLGMSVY